MARLLAGALLVNLGEAADGRGELDQALAGFRELGERWGVGQALVARAELSAAAAEPEPPWRRSRRPGRSWPGSATERTSASC